MVYFTLFFTNLMNEDQGISHVNDPYYAKTKNKGTSTITEDQEPRKKSNESH